MVIKTKKAPILWNDSNKVTCTYSGEKDAYGKAIWRDADGNEYELIYAKLAKKYSFNPMRLIAE